MQAAAGPFACVRSSSARAATRGVFTHGGSQAVRLPKEIRFEGTEVYVRRVGNEVVLSAAPPPGVDALLEALADFEPGASIAREQPAEQQRRAPIRPKR